MQPTPLLSSTELLADLRALGKTTTFETASLANEVDQDEALAALSRFTVSWGGGSSAKATPKLSEERLQEDALDLSARILAANDWLKSNVMTEKANRIAEESASLRKLLGKIVQLLALGSQGE